jgi:quercetin dioxygenase-like cupin family protein
MIGAGDSVRFEPGEEHWHGAALQWFIAHLALHEAGDDGVEADWGAHVTDEEYGAKPRA